jgi:hypothetical protein
MATRHSRPPHAQHLDGRVHTARRAGHLERHLRARVAGPRADQGADVVRGGVPDGQPQSLGQRTAVGAQLHHPHLGPGGLRDQRDQHPDRSAADDHDLLALGDPRPADVVHGHRGGLHQRHPVQRE